MFLIKVSPILSRSFGATNELTYFCKNEIKEGSIINVPIRGKSSPAIILKTENAKDARVVVRRGDFQIKKISAPRSFRKLSPQIINAVKSIADYFAISVGVVISSCVPTSFISLHTTQNANQNAETDEISLDTKAHFGLRDYIVLQAPFCERVHAYKTLVRESFATNETIILLTPTIRECKQLFKELSKGIEKNSVLLTSEIPSKKQKEIISKINETVSTHLIVATPLFIGSINKLGTIILERENSQQFIRFTNPKIDMRIVAEHFAKAHNAKLVCADSFLRIKTYADLESDLARALDSIPRRLKGSNPSIEDLRAEWKSMKKEYEETKSLPVLSQQIKKPEYPLLGKAAISLIKQHKEKGIFIFTTRLGISTTIICNDCREKISCKKCHSSVTLHTKGNKRTFFCRRCGDTRDAHEKCVACDSWNLSHYGIGSERVESFVKSRFPDTPIIRIDSGTVKNEKDLEKLIIQFEKEKGIVIGTEMALSAFRLPLSASICVSVDSLFAISDFTIDETVFALLTLIREKTDGPFLIQTNNPQNSVLKYASEGNAGQFAREELETRKELNYPPFSVIIRIICSGTRDCVKRDMQKLAIIFARHKPRIFNDFITIGKTVSLHALLRVHADSWPKKDLIELLRGLPSSFTVEINPSSHLT